VTKGERGGWGGGGQGGVLTEEVGDDLLDRESVKVMKRGGGTVARGKDRKAFARGLVDTEIIDRSQWRQNS